jgi:hypothetical protein
MQPRVPGPGVNLLQLYPLVGQAPEPPRVSGPWGGLPFCCVFPNPTTCYFNSVHLKCGISSCCVPLDLGRARPSSHILTRCVPTCQGRQVTFKLTIGNQTATAVGMVCPIRRDSTRPTMWLLWIALLSTDSRRCSYTAWQDKACWVAKDDDGVGWLKTMMVMPKLSEVVRINIVHTL